MKKMIRKIPRKILEKYKDNKLYVKLRWRLCPFELIESFIPEKGTILDLGCGYGILANLMFLKNKNRDIIGVDSSVSRIYVAKKSNNKIKFLLEGIEDFELKNFDAAVMSDFLHHINYETQNKLLKQIYKDLRKNGVLVIQEVANKPLPKYLVVWVLDHFLNLGEKIYYRKPKEFTNFLSKVGFKVKKIRADKGLPLSDIIYLCKKA